MINKIEKSPTIEDNARNPSARRERGSSGGGGNYEIKIRGHLDEHWSEWFDYLNILPDDQGYTVLSGFIVDQAALHGVLAGIRDLGLVLVSLTRLET